MEKTRAEREKNRTKLGTQDFQKTTVESTTLQQRL